VRKNRNSDSIYIDDDTVEKLSEQLYQDTSVGFDHLVIATGRLAKAYLQRDEMAGPQALITAASALEIYLDHDGRDRISFFSFSARVPFAFDALKEEIALARTKFPSNKFLLAALMEEVGELFEADINGEGEDRIRKEAIQVACVAVRIYEETDATFDDITEAQAKL